MSADIKRPNEKAKQLEEERYDLVERFEKLAEEFYNFRMKYSGHNKISKVRYGVIECGDRSHISEEGVYKNRIKILEEENKGLKERVGKLINDYNELLEKTTPEAAKKIGPEYGVIECGDFPKIIK